MLCDEKKKKKKKKKKKRDRPLFVLFYGLRVEFVSCFFYFLLRPRGRGGMKESRAERVWSRLIVAYFCFVVIRLMARSYCILETRFFELPGHRRLGAQLNDRISSSASLFLSLSLSLEYSTAQHSTTLDVVMLLLASGVDFNQLCSRRIQFPGRFSLLLLRPMLQPTISLSTQYFLSFFLLSFFCAPFSSFARKEGRASLGRRANNRRSNREKIKMSQSTMRTEWSQVEY